jgi:enoyl-CoA hydratase/carnithine racemase
VTTPQSSEEVYLTRDGEVATLWLNRPEKRNAITNAMWRNIGDLVNGLADDSDVRLLVLRGVGDHFCAGADIHGLAEMSLREYHEANQHADEALATFPKPTLAVITGSCIGGGAELASCCDMRIAATGSKFGITPSKLGIIYPAYALERVVSLIGPSATKHLLFTGDIIDDRSALRIGLINELVAVDEFEDRAQSLISTLVERSLLTQIGTKEMVDAISSNGFIDDNLNERWHGILETSPDMGEGIRAFAEKRKPVFAWRP